MADTDNVTRAAEVVRRHRESYEWSDCDCDEPQWSPEHVAEQLREAGLLAPDEEQEGSDAGDS